MTATAALRIDKLLWFLRLASSRSMAQALAQTGHVRLNGRRVERASAVVRSGDVLVLPPPAGSLRGTVRVIEIVTLPLRRGPAIEAMACYRLIGPGAPGESGAAAERFGAHTGLTPAPEPL